MGRTSKSEAMTKAHERALPLFPDERGEPERSSGTDKTWQAGADDVVRSRRLSAAQRVGQEGPPKRRLSESFVAPLRLPSLSGYHMEVLTYHGAIRVSVESVREAAFAVFSQAGFVQFIQNRDNQTALTAAFREVWQKHQQKSNKQGLSKDVLLGSRAGKPFFTIVQSQHILKEWLNLPQVRDFVTKQHPNMEWDETIYEKLVSKIEGTVGSLLRGIPKQVNEALKSPQDLR